MSLVSLIFLFLFAILAPRYLWSPYSIAHFLELLFTPYFHQPGVILLLHRWHWINAIIVCCLTVGLKHGSLSLFRDFQQKLWLNYSPVHIYESLIDMYSLDLLDNPWFPHKILLKTAMSEIQIARYIKKTLQRFLVLFLRWSLV